MSDPKRQETADGTDPLCQLLDPTTMRPPGTSLIFLEQALHTSSSRKVCTGSVAVLGEASAWPTCGWKRIAAGCGEAEMRRGCGLFVGVGLLLSAGALGAHLALAGAVGRVVFLMAGHASGLLCVHD